MSSSPEPRSCVDRALEERDRLLVAALVEEREALVVEIGAVARSGLGGGRIRGGGLGGCLLGHGRGAAGIGVGAARGLRPRPAAFRAPAARGAVGGVRPSPAATAIVASAEHDDCHDRRDRHRGKDAERAEPPAPRRGPGPGRAGLERATNGLGRRREGVGPDVERLRRLAGLRDRLGTLELLERCGSRRGPQLGVALAHPVGERPQRRAGALAGQVGQQDAEGVEVRALARRVAGHDLGGDERLGAEHLAGAGEGRRVEGLGDPEVGEPRVPVVVDEDVLRLDVTVQDAGRVDVAEGGEQLARHLVGAGRVTAIEPGGEIAALDVLHHQVGPLARVEVVDGNEVGVLDAGGDPRLAPEAADVLGVCGERVGEDLHRHRAPEPLVGGQPDHRHPAVAEPPLEQVPLAQAAPGRDQGRLGDRGPARAPGLGVELVGGSFVVPHDLLRFPIAAGPNHRRRGSTPTVGEKRPPECRRRRTVQRVVKNDGLFSEIRQSAPGEPWPNASSGPRRELVAVVGERLRRRRR